MIAASVVEDLAQELERVGLNRCRMVPVAELSSSVWLPDTDDDRRSSRGSSFLVVGHAGQAMWSYLEEEARRSGAAIESEPDPVDTFSVAETEAALNRFLSDVPRRLLYPRERCPVDLVALGLAIRWQTTSPLGLGIHPRYGLWSAFRVVWEVGDAVESSVVSPLPDVCAQCASHDCVAACPVGAVQVGRRFDVTACFAHRAPLDSECGETCLARVACPVGPEFRYGADQLAYHYRQSRPGPMD